MRSGVMSMGAQCAAASVVVVDHGACNTYHALIWACAEAHVMRGSVCIRTWGIAEGVHGGVTGGDAGGGHASLRAHVGSSSGLWRWVHAL